MRLGIDFGTTRTVVASCDRGNYPVVGFLDEAGDPVDFYPSVVAERAGELRFGFDALKVAADPSFTVRRSFKRELSGRHPTPDRQVKIGSTQLTLLDLLTRFLMSLRKSILQRVRHKKGNDPIIAAVATPAGAHGMQRFITLDAFRRAGFDVVALVNEPSAAGFEYTHRYRSTFTQKRDHIVIYDLGGGTFDSSLVRMNGKRHDAVATAGSNHLGGDDFDATLANLVLRSTKLRLEELPDHASSQLLNQCRAIKEGLHPNSKRIVVDLESALGELAPTPEVTVSTSEYYEACIPLVEETIEVMRPVIQREGQREGHGDGLDEVAGLYVVGGASSLPVVSRLLRERYGRRVHRSQYPSAAIAIGLALAADKDAGFELSDRLSRYFGVFRESRGGTEVVFDPIFDRETRVPGTNGDAVVLRRRYRAAHNVGRYRFVECTGLDPNGVPIGDITAWKELLFPFDPALRERDLGAIPVMRMQSAGPLIEEQYAVTTHGIVEVTITDLESGYGRAFQLGMLSARARVDPAACPSRASGTSPASHSERRSAA